MAQNCLLGHHGPLHASTQAVLLFSGWRQSYLKLDGLLWTAWNGEWGRAVWAYGTDIRQQEKQYKWLLSSRRSRCTVAEEDNNESVYTSTDIVRKVTPGYC